MANAFQEGLEKKGSFEIHNIYLRDIPFHDYSYKYKKPNEDETQFKNLTENIQTADALIIATPTYNFSVPSRLKNFIDRIGFFALDYSKKTITKQPMPQLKYLQTFFLVSGGSPRIISRCLCFLFPQFWLMAIFKYYGAKTRGSLYGGGLSYCTPARQNKKLLKECQNAGKKFAKNLIK